MVMAIVKRISALVALLVIPAGLAWAGQLLGGHAGSPDVGNASITVSVDPRDPGRTDDAPRVRGPQSQSPGDGAEETDAPGPEAVRPGPVPTVEPVAPTAENTAPPTPQISDVQRQPLPAPAQEWDDDWDDDDWDDDTEDDDWDDDGE